MSGMDLEIARRIEGVNAHALALHVEVMSKLFPETQPAFMNVAGGVASFAWPNLVVNYAVGLGLAGKVSSGDIANVVEFFQSRGSVPRVDVCPLCDESLLDALRDHDFQLHFFMNVLTRTLSPSDVIAPQPDGIHVRPARPDEDGRWAEVLDAGFTDGGVMTEERRRLGLLLFHRPNCHPCFAEIDGKPVGGGAMFTEDGYAGLAATSVIPEFRGRGVHAALIRARLRLAIEQGCDRAGFFASPGSISQRNAERHGFAVAYTKAVMKRTMNEKR